MEHIYATDDTRIDGVPFTEIIKEAEDLDRHDWIRFRRTNGYYHRGDHGIYIKSYSTVVAVIDYDNKIVIERASYSVSTSRQVYRIYNAYLRGEI